VNVEPKMFYSIQYYLNSHTNKPYLSMSKQNVKPTSNQSALKSLTSLKDGINKPIHLGNNIKEDITIQEAATDIFKGYEKKMGFCGRSWDNIKRFFGKTTDRGVIKKLYQEIMTSESQNVIVSRPANLTNLPEVNQLAQIVNSNPFNKVPPPDSTKTKKKEKKEKKELDKLEKQTKEQLRQAKELEKETDEWLAGQPTTPKTTPTDQYRSKITQRKVEEHETRKNEKQGQNGKNKGKLEERGDMLANLAVKTGDMEESSEGFAQAAKKWREQEQAEAEAFDKTLVGRFFKKIGI
jgi:hypothetical protein